MEIIEDVQGPCHPLLAEYLSYLGEILRLQGKNVEATSICTRALEIFEDTLGLDHLDIASVLDELSLHYENDEKFSDAEESYERSLKIRVDALGPDHTDVASSLGRYARFLRFSGRLEEAVKMETQAESIRTPQSMQSNRVEAEPVGQVMAWVQRRQLKKRNTLNSNVLKYPFYYLPAGVLGIVFFLAMYLISLVHPSNSVRLATAIIFLGFVFGCAVSIAQYFRICYQLESEGLAYRTFLKNRGFMCWSDITRVRYLWIFNWFRIEGGGGKIIHISDQLTSFPKFANAVLRNVPMECMDQSTVNVLELRAAKPPPSV